MLKRALMVVLLLVGFVYPQQDSLTLTEIMFRPTAANSEFVEIYNYSTSVNYNLSGYKIKYSNQNPDVFADAGEGLWILPGQYAVIVEADYNLATGIYSIPDEALIISIDNNAFGNGGMSNSSDRPVKFINASGDTISSRTYTTDNAAGISDEKIINTGDDNSNWSNSLVLNGTPGFTNSVTPLVFDLSITSFTSSDYSAFINETITINAIVKNIGTNTADNYSIIIGTDLNNNGQLSGAEIIYNQIYVDLEPDDSVLVNLPLEITNNQIYKFLCVVDYQDDLNLTNNKSSFEVEVITPPAEYGDISITEIMFAPQTGNSEWVEIYNRTDTTINLKGWRIADISGSAQLSSEDLFILPGEFLILCDNTNFLSKIPWNYNATEMNLPSLNNNGDKIKILDLNGDIVDSIAYASDWSVYGISTEKIDLSVDDSSPDNWGQNELSFSHSAGIINSISRKTYDLALLKIEMLTDYVTPGETLNVKAKIKNYGESVNTGSVLQVFDKSQQVEAILINQIESGEDDLLNFELSFIDTGLHKLSFIIGDNSDIYPYNDSLSASLTVVEPTFNYGDVLINEVMFAPETGNGEWLELYNNTEGEINLKGFYIADEKDTIRVTEDKVLLEGGELLVLSDDENINDLYSHSVSFIKADLPTLNNNGDRIILMDSLFMPLDSLNYYGWLYEKGKSVEQINYNTLLADSLNWQISAHPEGGTPGVFNSVSPVDYDIKMLSFRFSKEIYAEGSTHPYTFTFVNNGTETIASLTIKLIKESGGELVAQNFVQLLPDDTTIVNGVLTAQDFGITTIFLHHNLQLDRRTWNDTLAAQFKVVHPQEERFDILVNEFMAAPVNDEPEWIELYNTRMVTINLRSYKIADSKDTVSLPDEDIFIAPNNYFIITQDIIKGVSDDFVIADLPALNNNGDQIILMDSLYRIIDSLEYTDFPLSRGVSTEKTNTNLYSDDPENWGLCIHPDSSTPNVLNSVVARNYDLTVTSIDISQEEVVFGDSVKLTIVIENKGLLTSGSFSVSVTFGNDETETYPYSYLNSNDLKVLKISYLPNSIGDYIIKVKLHYNEDEILWNNNKSASFRVVEAYMQIGQLIINEFMPNPDTGLPEWIELFNRSDNVIPVTGLMIADSKDSTALNAPGSKILPYEYCIISRDSSILSFYDIPAKLHVTNLPTLNNDADRIEIRDSLGRIIDSLSYNEDWNGVKGKSFERVSPEDISFAVSKNNGTPGRINSVAIKNFNLKVDSLKTLPAKIVKGREYKVQVYYSNDGNQLVENISLSLKINNESAKTYGLPDLESGLNGVYTSDNLTCSEDTLLISAEIMAVSDEYIYDNKQMVTFYAGVTEQAVIINEIMFDPINGNPEWIELFVNQNEKVNLNNWSLRIGENNNRVRLVDTNYYAESQDYVLVADKNSFFEDYISAGITLPNSGNSVVLYDRTGTPVDSVCYFLVSYKAKGISIERCFDCLTQFYPSVDITGSTPGSENSISTISEHNFEKLQFNEIMYEPESGRSEFIEFHNSSDEEINVAGILLIAGTDTFMVSANTHYILPEDYFVTASDSSIEDYVEKHKVHIQQKSLNLSNEGEVLQLIDLYGNVIDSMTYNPDWHSITESRGRSLEKISLNTPSSEKQNWSSSVDPSGSTPGRQNSIFSDNSNIRTGITFEPNPFSPDDDGYEDVCKIKFNLKANVNSLRIRIFDSKGRLVRNLTDDKLTSSAGTIIFDGKDDNGRALRMGIYIVLTEAFGLNNNSVETFKQTVVVARKL